MSEKCCNSINRVGLPENESRNRQIECIDINACIFNRSGNQMLKGSPGRPGSPGSPGHIIFDASPFGPQVPVSPGSPGSPVSPGTPFLPIKPNDRS